MWWTLLAACQDDGPPPGDDDDATLAHTGAAPHSSTTGTTLQGTRALQFRGDVPKNLLFLSIDTFRKDNLGTYGNDKALTPFLDGLADQGVVLDDHLQCSCWTFASTTCTLAGRSNIERGHIPRLVGDPSVRPKVPEGTPFLATWLGEAGYWSGIVSGNSWLSPTWGNTQGYDVARLPGGPAPAVYATGLEALREARAAGEADRWFLHLHFMEPHASYNPPEEYIIGEELLEPWPNDLTNRDLHYWNRSLWPTMAPDRQALLEQHLRLLYEGEVRGLDHELGAIWEQLEAEGLLDDTLVVIWNDHGEAFWEHGFQTHAYSLTAEENDGALIFWARNLVPGRWTEPTMAIDLVPTLLDLQGIPLPPEVTGVPIGSAPVDRPRYAEVMARLGGQNAVTRGGLKLIYFWGGTVVVYDRRVDPLETTDLFDRTNPVHLELYALAKAQALAMAPLIIGGDPAPVFDPTLP
jgi:arylsulfatase A-like enzyme